jgi:RIO-like serine/threonine protein kinase
MVLVKENIQKKRQTWKSNNFYRKVWLFEDLHWQEHHVNLLNEVIPGYVIGKGNADGMMWIDYNIIPGVPASTLKHTDKFIKQIYNFCVKNIQDTKPYAHGDWVLSNILVDGDTLRLCDWDNLNIYPEEDKLVKLRLDLRSAFGKRFDEVIQ